ncbi:MAG: iron-containing alcohol dehydrogenase [Verrucomicrobiota bacterium]|nr:iron-containing alcohol dehydrogenase [Verrucomicrobiota bacterium]
MRFEFATVNRIAFGPGAVKEIAPTAATYGRVVMLVTGSNPARAAGVRAALQRAGQGVVEFAISGEPTVEQVEQGAALARQESCAVVVAFGGGSVIDAGKAIAALAPLSCSIFDHLEIIGKGLPLNTVGLPCIAVPTTAGTGAEVTRNSVLTSSAHRLKVSLRSPHMLPKLAVVDPELTYELSPELSASTGMDALTQLIEPFTSNAANPMTDALCREAIPHAARSLRRVCTNARDATARESMALASLFGGLALANAKLGAVHGFAGVIGGRTGAAHGVICARLLPTVTERNIRALRERSPESPVLARYAEVARMLTGNHSASADDAVAWLRALIADLPVPAFATCGLRTEDYPEIAALSLNASSMKGNPVAHDTQALVDVLKAL